MANRTTTASRKTARTTVTVSPGVAAKLRKAGAVRETVIVTKEAPSVEAVRRRRRGGGFEPAPAKRPSIITTAKAKAAAAVEIVKRKLRPAERKAVTPITTARPTRVTKVAPAIKVARPTPTKAKPISTLERAPKPTITQRLGGLSSELGQKAEEARGTAQAERALIFGAGAAVVGGVKFAASIASDLPGAFIQPTPALTTIGAARRVITPSKEITMAKELRTAAAIARRESIRGIEVAGFAPIAGEAAAFVAGPAILAKGFQLARGVAVRTGAQRIAAAEIFEPAVLRGEATFPLARPAEAVKAFRSAEGRVVTAAPRPLRTKIPVIGREVEVLSPAGKAGARGFEDPGLFVTPRGRGSPFFLEIPKDIPFSERGLPSVLERQLTFDPRELVQRPFAAEIGLREVRRLPSGVVTRARAAKAAGRTRVFEEAALVGREAPEGTAFITLRSELGQTRELEAIIPETTRLRRVGPRRFTEVKGVPVAFPEFEVVGLEAAPTRAAPRARPVSRAPTAPRREITLRELNKQLSASRAPTARARAPASELSLLRVSRGRPAPRRVSFAVPASLSRLAPARRAAPAVRARPAPRRLETFRFPADPLRPTGRPSRAPRGVSDPFRLRPIPRRGRLPAAPPTLPRRRTVIDIPSRKVRRPRRAVRRQRFEESLAFSEGFTAKVLGLEQEVTQKQFEKILGARLTGLELRPALRLKRT